MLDFFKGWKRKAGCVTLLMACAVTSLWVRSLSGAHIIKWDESGLVSIEFEFMGFGCSVGSASFNRSEFEIPYLWLVIGLTLVSFWLLLSKSRPNPTKSPLPENHSNA